MPGQLVFWRDSLVAMNSLCFLYSTLLVRSSDLECSGVNKAINENFPAWSVMMKIIVTPDKDVVPADCVIISLADTGWCL